MKRLTKEELVQVLRENRKLSIGISSEALAELAAKKHTVRSRKELQQKTGQRCPFCDADLTGGPIPEEHRHHYGGKTHFSRLIGIEENDRIARWRCPDCGKEWT